MVKGRMGLALAIFTLALLNLTTVSAEETKEELKAKLTELRNRKAEMTSEYKLNLERIKKESEDKIAVLKTNFRIAREKCLEEKYDKSEELRKDFEGRLRPVLKEEEALVGLIGRDAREDFVKTKVEREAE